MKKNAYQNLMEHIRPPAGLNDRVLFAARRRTAEQEPAGPKRLAPRKRRPVVRAAVCAACALALVAGSVTLGPIGGGETAVDGAPVTALPTFSFGLTAYAADTGERYEANANGGLAFSTSGQGSWSAEDGHYTGCLFQVAGFCIFDDLLDLGDRLVTELPALEDGEGGGGQDDEQKGDGGVQSFQTNCSFLLGRAVQCNSPFAGCRSSGRHLPDGTPLF